MNKLKTWLYSLLAIQVVIAVLIFLSSQYSQVEFESKQLLNFKTESITKITISDGNNEVELRKNDSVWQLPGYHGLNVESDQLDSAISKLSSLKSNWPIATSSSSHERFELTEDKFQRRIRLFDKDEQVGELYLGTSPGFKKVHLRPSDDDNVYAIETNSFDFPIETKQWFDKKLLQSGEVKAIKTADYSLDKTNDQWQFSGSSILKDGIQLNLEKTRALEQSISSLTVIEVSEKEVDFSEGKLISVDFADKSEAGNNQSFEYRLVSLEEKYYVNRNDRDLAFVIDSNAYESMSNITLADLEVAKPVEIPVDGGVDTQPEESDTTSSHSESDISEKTSKEN